MRLFGRVGIGLFLLACFAVGGGTQASRHLLSIHRRPFDLEDAFVALGLGVAALIVVYGVTEIGIRIRGWLGGGPP
jgi:hypothetical protein